MCWRSKAATGCWFLVHELKGVPGEADLVHLAATDPEPYEACDTMAELLQFISSGLTVGAIYALVALGFTLIYKASDIINFAQG